MLFHFFSQHNQFIGGITAIKEKLQQLYILCYKKNINTSLNFFLFLEKDIILNIKQSTPLINITALPTVTVRTQISKLLNTIKSSECMEGETFYQLFFKKRYFFLQRNYYKFVIHITYLPSIPLRIWNILTYFKNICYLCPSAIKESVSFILEKAFCLKIILGHQGDIF